MTSHDAARAPKMILAGASCPKACPSYTEDDGAEVDVEEGKLQGKLVLEEQIRLKL